MTFLSILHAGSEDVPGEVPLPGAMSDLQLEQIIEAVTAGHQKYDLKPVFHTPLRDEGTAAYRQCVCRDLETGAVSVSVAMGATPVTRGTKKRVYSGVWRALRKHPPEPGSRPGTPPITACPFWCGRGETACP